MSVVVITGSAGLIGSEAAAYFATLGFAVEQLRSVRANVLGTVLNDFGKRETSNDSAHRYIEPRRTTMPVWIDPRVNCSTGCRSGRSVGGGNPSEDGGHGA